jgi:toxin ParE1/3/4
LTPHYILGPDALADLRGIVAYTRREWGFAQVHKYRDRLERCAEALVTRDSHNTDLSHLRPGLRMMRCQHHYIVAQIREGQPAEIVAILHERMDWVARLGERLKS